MSAEKGFLGRGWEFPVKPGPDGNLGYAEFDDDIRKAVRLILETAPGERVMRPRFGCVLPTFAFELLNTATLTSIESSIRDALTRFEPRIDVLEVEVDSSRAGEGVLLVSLSYAVRRTNARTNLVYPFYLTEGR